MSSDSVAFVTGGSGFVGQRLIRALVAQGWEVRALARTRTAAAHVERLGAVPVLGGLGDAQAMHEGLLGSEVVFHVAAHFKLWGDLEEFEKVNVDGMRVLVDAALAAPSVRKIVAVSASAVVQGDPKPMVEVDEAAPIQTRSFAPYSASKAKGERILLSANLQRPGFETVALRPPLVWGAGMPMLDHMVETVRKGQWQWVGGGNQLMSTCHVDNLVDALLLAAAKGRGGEAYFVADAEQGTLKSVVGDLLATRSVVAANSSVSFGLAWLMAGVMGVVWRLLRLKGEPPITRQMLRLIGKPFTVRTDKAKRDLQYVPGVSWQQGISEMTTGIGRSSPT